MSWRGRSPALWPPIFLLLPWPEVGDAGLEWLRDVPANGCAKGQVALPVNLLDFAVRSSMTAVSIISSLVVSHRVPIDSIDSIEPAWTEVTSVVLSHVDFEPFGGCLQVALLTNVPVASGAGLGY